MPAGVVFGARAGKPVALPEDARTLTGRVAQRGTRWSDAQEKLATGEGKVERGSDEGLVSPYAGRFYQGAIILPRVLLTVRELPSGPLGTPTGTRRVASLRSPLEKAPWKDVKSLEGVVEQQFLRRVLFGANIAPFRILEETAEAVIPRSNNKLIDGTDPTLDEYPGLAAWWRQAEEIWEGKRSASTRLSLREQLDYYGKLSGQFPLQRNRVVYTKSGLRITACRLEEPEAIIDHTLYWATVDSVDEGRYLTAILNSDAVHAKIEPLMSEGLFGKRHIDKYVFAVPFPTFDPESELHQRVAGAAARAEAIAAEVDMADEPSVTAARRRVRETLAEKGVTAEIEELLAELLPRVPLPT